MNGRFACRDIGPIYTALVAVELHADGLSLSRVDFEIPVGSKPEATNFLRVGEEKERLRVSCLAEALVGELVALETVTGVRPRRVCAPVAADVRLFSAFVDIGTRDVVCHEVEARIAVTGRTIGGNEAPLAAFFLAALVDLAEGSFVSAVATILPAIAHL